MNRRRIEQFLKTLAAELDGPARVYLTGAAAAALLGRVRPSLDIDFGIEIGDSDPASWRAVQEAVNRASKLSGIAASAAQDIDRWGMISLLDYKKTARRHGRFGRLEVRVLHPLHWSIGKLTRFLDVDIDDVAQVFRRQAIKAPAAAKLWGRALRASPPSTAQFQFRRQVESFFLTRGRAIWGSRFDSQACIRLFYRAAEIPLPPTSTSLRPRDRTDGRKTRVRRARRIH
jgi:hypothetical protein